MEKSSAASGFVSPPCLPAVCFIVHLCTHTQHTPFIQTHTAHTHTPYYACIHTHTTLTHTDTLLIDTQYYTCRHTLHISTAHYTHTQHTHTCRHILHLCTQYYPHITCTTHTLRIHTTHTCVHTYTVYTTLRAIRARTHTYSLLLCHNIADSAAALFVFPPPASPLQQCSK